MDLILWRHAEAEELEEGLSDVDRALTFKGRRQATKIALWLREHLPETPQILVSPARRAQQTATHLGLPYLTEPKLGMGQSPLEALEATGWPKKEGICLLIGHQPMLGQIIGELLASQYQDWPVKKGSIWWFASRTDDQQKIALRTVINPKLVD